MLINNQQLWKRHYGTTVPRNHAHLIIDLPLEQGLLLLKLLLAL